MRQLTTLLDDLTFGEGPRWRNGFLYFSDFYDCVVKRVSLDGVVEEVVNVPKQPSGLGWLPDGRMLIVSMIDQKLMVFDGTSLAEYADLSDYATHHCNDMVVDDHGNAYIGNFGFDSSKGEAVKTTNLILVRADQTVDVAADGLSFPNGTVITPDGKTLIIGETYASCLTAFDIQDDATLSNRRLWADLSPLAPDNPPVPDGMCLDTQGAIWVASPTTKEVLRMAENGAVLERITLDRGAFACMLGGEDGKTLFIVSCKTSIAERCAVERKGRIEICTVDHAGAGKP